MPLLHRSTTSGVAGGPVTGPLTFRQRMGRMPKCQSLALTELPAAPVAPAPPGPARRLLRSAGRAGSGPGDRSTASRGLLALRLPRRIAGRRLSLALQGGGAHGAFTWGVLDRLLEVGRLDLDTVSGSSAGAVNAVTLATGWLEGGAEGARERLAQLWQAVSERTRSLPLAPGAVRAFAIGLAAHLFSPHDLNPLGIDPLRDIVEGLVDFERLRGQRGLRLLVAATSVRTGTARIFETREMTVDVVLASAALPQLHEPVLIDGEAYWDGGLSSNPPLVELALRSARPASCSCGSRRGRRTRCRGRPPRSGPGSPRSCSAGRCAREARPAGGRSPPAPRRAGLVQRRASGASGACVWPSSTATRRWRSCRR